MLFSYDKIIFDGHNNQLGSALARTRKCLAIGAPKLGLEKKKTTNMDREIRAGAAAQLRVQELAVAGRYTSRNNQQSYKGL